ncbi:MAG: DUF6053 domain-containing protein [Lysobacter sp.]
MKTQWPAICAKSVGAEAPPTKDLSSASAMRAIPAPAAKLRARAGGEVFCGKDFSPDAFRSGRAALNRLKPPDQPASARDWRK